MPARLNYSSHQAHLGKHIMRLNKSEHAVQTIASMAALFMTTDSHVCVEQRAVRFKGNLEDFELFVARALNAALCVAPLELESAADDAVATTQPLSMQ